MLCALAFLPPDEVEANFNILRNNAPEEMYPIVDYFKSTYINRMRARWRTWPGLTLFRCPPLVVGKYHPSLYASFEELSKEQADAGIMLRQIQLGQRIRKFDVKEEKKGLIKKRKTGKNDCDCSRLL